MQSNELAQHPEPTLRQILSSRGIEHSGDVARRQYLARRERSQIPGADMRGVEVVYLEPELIELA